MVVPVRIFFTGFSSLGGLGSDLVVSVGVDVSGCDCACACACLSLRDNFKTPVSSSLSSLFRF